MRRKIIKLAQNTLVVSLPAKWAKRHALRKGAEVEVEEIGSMLKILAEPGATKGATTVRFDSKDHFLRRIVDTPYRMGYDEVRIEYDDPSLYYAIQSEINNLMGFEIIKQGKGYCVARNIAQGIESEFMTSQNRLFLVTIQFLVDIRAALEGHDWESLGIISQTEETTNRLAHFCKRMLNLERAPNQIRSRSTYRIISLLEEIGDLGKRLCLHARQEKIRMSEEGMAFLDATIEQLRMLYKLHSKWDASLIPGYGKQEKSNERRGIELSTKLTSDAYLIFLISMMVENIKHMSEEVFP